MEATGPGAAAVVAAEERLLEPLYLLQILIPSLSAMAELLAQFRSMAGMAAPQALIQ